MPKKFKKPIFVFLFLLLLVGLDIWSDHQEGAEPEHLLIEFSILLTCACAAFFQLSKWSAFKERNKKHIDGLNQQVSDLEKSLEVYREEYRDGVRKTFETWTLTSAESEVAVFLLKGMSLKEISEVRKSHESTIRSQCTSIYKKSNLSGRSQLSSYFLDGII